MKFEIPRELLLRPLALVTGVVERRQTLPVLSNVLLQAEGNQLTVTGSDLEVQLVAGVDLPGPVERSGEVTVPARKLGDIWRSLPDGVQVKIEQQADRVIVRAGRSRFTLSSLSAAEFPSLDTSPVEVTVTLPASELKRLLETTAFSMAQQDVRYFLNGLLVEITGEHVRTVATDGHRLAMCTRPFDGEGETLHQAIVPRKGVQELLRLLGEEAEQATLELGQNHLTATVGAYTLTTKLVDGKFPDYDRVVPKGGEREMLADRDALRSAFTRAAILSNEKYRGVRLSLHPDSLTVQANNPEQEEAEEVVEVEFRGEPMEIGFNVSYLQDVLNVIDGDEVRMTLIDQNSSAVIESGEHNDCVYVVMPMRL